MAALLVAVGGLAAVAPAGSAAPAKQPVVKGLAATGQQLTCKLPPKKATAGKTKAKKARFAWRRDGVAVPGATKRSYLVVPADEGHRISCVGARAHRALAASTPVVVTRSAVNTVAPSLSLSGTTLTCSPGTWLNEPTLTYAWTRNGSPIKDAATGTLSIAGTTYPANTQITCLVKGVNVSGGSGFVPSAIWTIGYPNGVKPTGTVNTVGPKLTLTGTGATATLTCDPGSWTEGQSLVTYAWKRDGSEVRNATTNTLVVGANATGVKFSCLVTNPIGGGGAVSTLIYQIGVDGLLHPISGPAVTTSPTVTLTGTVLSCDPGTWTGYDAGGYTWKLNGVLVPGETLSTLNTGAATPGDRTYACVVTATNEYGATEASASHKIWGTTPTNSVAPTVTRSGMTLTCNAGTWDAAKSFTYVWWRDGSPTTTTSSTFTMATTGFAGAYGCVVTGVSADGLTKTDAPSNNLTVL